MVSRRRCYTQKLCRDSWHWWKLDCIAQKSWFFSLPFISIYAFTTLSWTPIFIYIIYEYLPIFFPDYFFLLQLKDNQTHRENKRKDFVRWENNESSLDCSKTFLGYPSPASMIVYLLCFIWKFCVIDTCILLEFQW